MEEEVKAAVYKGQKLGKVVYMINGNEVAGRDIISGEDVPRITVPEMFVRNLRLWLDV